MDYFQPYSLSVDETIVAAWDSQVAEAVETPWLADALTTQSADLFPRFAACYAQLRALPRGARRALQRQLARSRELTAVSPEWQQKLARSLAGAALLLALAQGAQAATITVTTNIPGINDGDGKCSLIEAIINANDDAATHADCIAGDPGVNNTIMLPKNKTHTLTYAYDNRYGPTGLPVITSKITIQGNGGKIIRQDDAPDFRLIAVSSSGDLTLQHVTLSGGVTPYGGGGIANYGTLTIENSAISGNAAGTGGGVFNKSYKLLIQNSTISGNTAVGDFPAGKGGGVFNDNDGTLTIKNSTISDNTALEGGGIFNQYTSYTISTIEDSNISGNTAGGGGGISSEGTLTITNSTISGNTGLSGGGGVVNISSYMTITNSTLSGNRAGPSGGGAIYNFSYLTIENSTISGNTVVGASPHAGSGSGGGVFNYYSGTITIKNSTISGNTASVGGGGVYNSKYSINYGDLTLNRSLISGNNAPTGPEIDSHGSVTADDLNLFGNNGNAGVTGFTPGASDIVPSVKLSKIIGPLKKNGGPTKTHALVKGSPAIDAIPSSDPACTGTDQRGKPRPHGPGCDIGAFEK